MGAQFRTRFPGALDEVRRLNDAAVRFLAREYGFSTLIHDVQLVLEEIATNVVRHGAPSGGPVTINVELEAEEAGVRVRVEDDGRPFDPTTAPDPATAPDPQPGTAPQRAGGYGLRIVRQTASAMRYRRTDDRNILEMWVPERP